MSSLKALADALVLEIKTFPDPNGTLAVIEGGQCLPFEIARLFYVYGVHAGDIRGQHAHKEASQVLICMRGRCHVTVDDGAEKKTFELERPTQALLIPPTLWAEQLYCIPATILLVLSDRHFDEADYIRDYPAFLAFRGAARAGGRK